MQEISFKKYLYRFTQNCDCTIKDAIEALISLSLIFDK